MIKALSVAMGLVLALNGSVPAATSVSINEKGKVEGVPVRAGVRFSKNGPAFSFAVGQSIKRRRHHRRAVPVIIL